jgi:hypothetical protein
MLEEEAMEQQGMMPGGGIIPGDVGGGGGCIKSGRTNGWRWDDA